MMLKSALFTTLVASIASMANAADLSGSARITPQDYYGLRKHSSNWSSFDRKR